MSMRNSHVFVWIFYIPENKHYMYEYILLYDVLTEPIYGVWTLNIQQRKVIVNDTKRHARSQ